MDLQVAGFQLRQRKIAVSSLSGERNGLLTIAGRMPPRRRHRTVPRLVLVLTLIYGAMVLLNPWAIHIGGRWTPFLTWTGTGKLVTANGTYPLLVTFSPSAHGSRLHLDGLRPTGGVSGWGWLCTPQGTTIRLRLYGTIYGGWGSTDGALMQFRLLERIQNFPTIQDGGYFDLFGHWHGPQLVMEDRGEWSAPFRSGLKITHASVALKQGNKSEFNAACAATSNFRRSSRDSGAKPLERSIETHFGSRACSSPEERYCAPRTGASISRSSTFAMDAPAKLS